MEVEKHLNYGFHFCKIHNLNEHTLLPEEAPNNFSLSLSPPWKQRLFLASLEKKWAYKQHIWLKNHHVIFHKVPFLKLFISATTAHKHTVLKTLLQQKSKPMIGDDLEMLRTWPLIANKNKGWCGDKHSVEVYFSSHLPSLQSSMN